MWKLASWNISSLLDKEGSIETARKCSGVMDTEERRVDQVVSELDRYGVVVGALQETKWFGNEVYRVSESMVLTTY